MTIRAFKYAHAFRAFVSVATHVCRSMSLFCKDQTLCLCFLLPFIVTRKLYTYISYEKAYYKKKKINSKDILTPSNYLLIIVHDRSILNWVLLLYTFMVLKALYNDAFSLIMRQKHCKQNKPVIVHIVKHPVELAPYHH